MEQKNIMFFENDDKSYTMVDLYLNNKFILKFTNFRFGKIKNTK